MAASDSTYFLVNASARGYGNRFAKISPEDAEKVLQYKWHAYRSKIHPHVFYAKADCGEENGVRKQIKLHRLILPAPAGCHIDHINGDGLDNRRQNLRIVTPQMNQANSRKRTEGTSRFKGVCWHSQGKKWRASIVINNRQIHLGLFTDEIEAARAYDKKALELFGEHACLNLTEKDAA